MLEYPTPAVERALCVNCGWRRSEVPPDVQSQVEAHVGEALMEERYVHDRIGTGKPPLSGWERTKRRRERERSGYAKGSRSTRQERNDDVARGRSVVNL